MTRPLPGRRRPQPAVLLTGAPATGKSTLGRRLARRLRAALIDQDVATGALVEVVARLVGSDDLDGTELAGLTRAARYQVLADLAVDNLAAGVPVVLVAPFTAERADPQAWQALHRQLSQAGGRPLLVWLSLPADQIEARLRTRGAARDRSKLADSTHGSGYLDRLADLTAAPSVPHLALPAQLPAPELARQVLAALKDV